MAVVRVRGRLARAGGRRTAVACEGGSRDSAALYFCSVLSDRGTECAVQSESSALSAQCSDSALESLCTQCAVLLHFCVFGSTAQCTVHCVGCGTGAQQPAWLPGTIPGSIDTSRIRSVSSQCGVSAMAVLCYAHGTRGRVLTGLSEAALTPGHL